MPMGSCGPLSNIIDKGMTIPLYARDAHGEIENDIGIYWNPNNFVTSRVETPITGHFGKSFPILFHFE